MRRFVSRIRLYKRSRAFARQRGFLAAVEDPALGQALVRIHREVARDWTVEELAREAGLSRSTFAERFSSLVGESPMRYLARWRNA